jgi:hypothetical protein
MKKYVTNKFNRERKYRGVQTEATKRERKYEWTDRRTKDRKYTNGHSMKNTCILVLANGF